MQAHFGRSSSSVPPEVFSEAHLKALSGMSLLNISDFEATRRDLAGIFQFTEMVKQFDVEESHVYAVSGSETNSRVDPILLHKDEPEKTPGAKDILSNASIVQRNHFVPKL